FSIPGLLQYTAHFCKYKLLNTFSPLSVSSRALVKAYRRSIFIFPQLPYEVAGPLTVCLESADWSCADHMHSPKKKKKTL
ncbi:unnamed protein product, partial [Staurois parvus]